MRLHILTLCVCVSYLTLGIFASDSARDLWAPYGIVTGVLAAVSLWNDYGRQR